MVVDAEAGARARRGREAQVGLHAPSLLSLLAVALVAPTPPAPIQPACKAWTHRIFVFVEEASHGLMRMMRLLPPSLSFVFTPSFTASQITGRKVAHEKTEAESFISG